MLCCQGKTISQDWLRQSLSRLQDPCKAGAGFHHCHQLIRGYGESAAISTFTVFQRLCYWIAAAIFLKAFESRTILAIGPLSTSSATVSKDISPCQIKDIYYPNEPLFQNVFRHHHQHSIFHCQLSSSTCYHQQAGWWPNLQLLDSCQQSLPTRFHTWTGQVSRPCTCFILWTPRKLVRCGNLAAVPALVESLEQLLKLFELQTHLKRLRIRFESGYRTGRINNPSGWIYKSCNSIIEKNLAPTQPFKWDDSLNVSTYK